jgi:thiol peroxidase
MTTKRSGEAFENGMQLTVLGRQLAVGDHAPAFTLESLNAGAPFTHTVSLDDSKGTTRVLHVVNSVDTPVCHIGGQRWEALQKELPANTQVYTISMDLPFGQLRWREANGVSHAALSAHKDDRFGKDYGVLLDEWRLLQRAVFVIDKGGTVKYAEYVGDQMREPNYEAAVSVAKSLS